MPAQFQPARTRKEGDGVNAVVIIFPDHAFIYHRAVFLWNTLNSKTIPIDPNINMVLEGNITYI